MKVVIPFIMGWGIAAAVLAGCATTDSTVQPDGLDDTGWILTTLRGAAVAPAAPITMSFEKGRVSGSDGCNRYGAGYSATGSQFKVAENMVSTRMACAEPVMRQGGDFLSALRAATAFRREVQQMLLLDAGGTVLASFTAQSTLLAGTSWRVTGYNNGKQAVVSVMAGSLLTVEFASDGRLSGSAGCNRYTAGYTTSGKSIRIEQAAATRKFCTQPPGVMEQEALYLRALVEAATYRVEGARLELRTATGALAVTLNAGDRR